MTDRKLGVGFWITVTFFVVLLAYPLSAGPVCWLWTRGLVPGGNAVYQFYSPLFAASHRFDRLRNSYIWYVNVGVPNENSIVDLMFAKAHWEWHERYPSLFPYEGYICGNAFR